MENLNLFGYMVNDLSHAKYSSAENEFQFVNSVLNMHQVQEIVLVFLNKYKPDTSKISTEISDTHRESGNRLFRADQKTNALAASRCYTDAIVTAPDQSHALALAHANRAASLLELGLYKEAYDDCECAVENGYPKKNMVKIAARQAFCASKLGDYEKLNACIEQLRTMTLNDTFQKQKEEFEEDLIKLKDKPTSQPEPASEIKCLRQQIMHDPEKQRFLAASQDIDKGEVIVVEKAFVMLPVGEVKVCSNCAAQQIIPFPCSVCSKVFYCSLKCKQAHEVMHKINCCAYKIGLTPDMGLVHFALNTLLKGLPSLVSNTKNCKSASEIWETLEKMACIDEVGYAEVLALVSNFKQLQKSNSGTLNALSTCVAVTTVYLKEYTSFFDLFRGFACSIPEWTTAISALLLKHTLQMMHNASVSVNLHPFRGTDGFQALSNVWESVGRLKKGHLHSYSLVRQSCAGIFPHLSICNHDCDPSFRTKFDGHYVAAYARRPLQRGAEIHNAYIMDYKNQRKRERKQDLKMHYHFDCKCKHCSAGDNDEAYLELHRYRCQKPKCKAVFTPRLKNLEWWMEDNDDITSLMCTVCKANLYLYWYWTFLDLGSSPSKISKIIDTLKFAEVALVGYSELRALVCRMAAEMLFNFWRGGAQLSDSDFVMLGDSVKYLLDFIEYKQEVRNIAYAAKATFALDLIALGKYSNFDRSKIRTSMEMISTEMRTIFDNYIADFIGEEF